jgi:hypothetical protein
MIWRKTSPLAEQFQVIAEAVRSAGQDLRERHAASLRC